MKISLLIKHKSTLLREKKKNKKNKKVKRDQPVPGNTDTAELESTED